MSLLHPLTCVLLLAAPAQGAEATNPGGAMLVEPQTLLRKEAREGIVFLDARTRDKFDEERLPGARWVDAMAWTKDFNDGKDVAAWTRRLANLGLTRQSRIVVYDDERMRSAARVWWVLKFWGFDDVRILHGGWVGARQVGLDAEKGPPSAIAPATGLQLDPRRDRLADKDGLLQALTDKKDQIVDARSLAEFTGAMAQAKRGGAIPGAKHLDWSDLVDSRTHRFKDVATLKQLVADAGIDVDKPCVTYCQSGARASVMTFVLELLGAKNVKNYYASWAEWGNADDTPVEAGKKE